MRVPLYLCDLDEPPLPRVPPEELLAAATDVPNKAQPWYFATVKASRTSAQ
jgi:hypothetical protein